MANIPREEGTSAPPRGVLFVLPEWGGGRGGIFSLSRATMRRLRRDGLRVTCVLGVSEDSLSPEELGEIRELGVTLLEPDVGVMGSAGETPLEVIQNPTEYYEHIHARLVDYSHIVAFSPQTCAVAKYFLKEDSASGCKLVLFNQADDISDSHVLHNIDVARSSVAIFSVGYHYYRKWNGIINGLERDLKNKHSVYIPDFLNYLSIPRSVSTMNQSQRRILVALLDFDHAEQTQRFLETCVCSINTLNKSFQSVGDDQYCVELLIQVERDTHAARNISCCPEHPQSMTSCRFLTIRSQHQLASRIGTMTAVIASGNFQYKGCSGLEHLMSGLPTLVPEDSHVGEIMKKFSPVQGESFLLKSLNVIHAEKTREEWLRKLIKVVKDPRSFHNAASTLANDITKSDASCKSIDALDRVFQG